MKRQAVHIFSGQRLRQNARAGHAFFNQLSWLVRSDQCGFAGAVTIDFADVFDDTYLHLDDFKLLADPLADGVLAAAAGTSQLMFGQFVDDLDARKASRQRLALATALGGYDELFFRVFLGNVGDAFCFIEKG